MRISKTIIPCLVVTFTLPSCGDRKNNEQTLLQAEQLRLLADSLSEAGELTPALDKYRLSAELSGSVGDSSGLAASLFGTGAVHWELQNNAEALTPLRQCSVLFEQLRDTLSLCQSLNMLAETLQRLHRYEESHPVLEKALALVGGHADMAEAVTVHNLSLNHTYLGQYTRALEYEYTALRVFTDLEYDEGIRSSLLQFGFIHRNLNQFDSAIIFYSQTLSLAREADAPEDEVIILGNMSKAYVGLGNHAKAERYADSALILATQLESRLDEGVASAQLGWARLNDNKPARAIGPLNNALAIFHELGYTEREAIVLHRLMLAARALNKPHSAILYGKRAVNLYQEIRSRVRALGPETLLDYTNTKEETYRELSDLLFAEKRDREAVFVIEMLKDDEYFDFVRGENETAGSDTLMLTAGESDWQERYYEIAGRVIAAGREYRSLLTVENKTPAQVQQFNRLKSEYEIASRAFEDFVARIEPALLSGKQHAILHDIARSTQWMNELSDGTVAIFTLMTGDRLHSFLIAPGARKSVEYPISSQELRRKVSEFREILRDTTRNPKLIARELYSIIVDPLEFDLKQANAKRILWSLDGALRYLPINALFDGKQWLVEKYENSLFTVSDPTTGGPSPRIEAGLGLGVSKAHEGFVALREVPSELRTIFKTSDTDPRGILPGHVMLDEEFTKSSLEESLARRYKLVHIASHFLLRPGDETNSFLLLGDGSRLTLDKVKYLPNLFDEVDLLTLSACNTAAGGAEANGKEVEGFAELAQGRGARTVIASLWPLEQHSTAELMGHFYSLFQSNRSPGKGHALREAQIALLRGDYFHPHYWAPFVLIGNWK